MLLFSQYKADAGSQISGVGKLGALFIMCGSFMYSGGYALQKDEEPHLFRLLGATTRYLGMAAMCFQLYKFQWHTICDSPIKASDWYSFEKVDAQRSNEWWLFMFFLWAMWSSFVHGSLFNSVDNLVFVQPIFKRLLYLILLKSFLQWTLTSCCVMCKDNPHSYMWCDLSQAFDRMQQEYHD